MKSTTAAALNAISFTATVTRSTHNNTRYSLTLTGKYAAHVMTASVAKSGKLTVRQDAIPLKENANRLVYQVVAKAIAEYVPTPAEPKAPKAKREPKAKAPKPEMPMTYRELQATLKQWRTEGRDVQVKLNAKTEVLLAEYNRLSGSQMPNAPVEPEAPTTPAEFCPLTRKYYESRIGTPYATAIEVARVSKGKRVRYNTVAIAA